MIFLFALISAASFATETPRASALSDICASVLANPIKSRVHLETFRLDEAETLEIRTREAEPNLIVRTISRRPIGSRDAELPRIDAMGHFRRIEPLVDFASGKFTRRKWSNAFSAPEKMRATARAHLRESTYFEVAERSTARTLGTLRVIRAARGEPLPEAKYLNLTLEGDPQFEVGTFAIEERIESRLRAAVWYELWLELSQIIFGSIPSRAYRATAIHTYGDEDSLGLYLPLGFDFLHPRPSDHAPPPPIQRDGSNWWPLVWTPFEVTHVNRAIWRGDRPTLRRASPRARCEAKGDAHAFFILDVPSLLESLAGPPDQRATLAEDALLERLGVLNEYDRELTCDSLGNRRRAERAIEEAEADLEKLETGFRGLLHADRASTRYRVAALLDEVLWRRIPRRALSERVIVEEFLPTLLLDEDLFVVMQAAHALRNLSLARYRGLHAESGQTAAEALGRLHAAHVPDAFIERAGHLLRRMWTEPVAKSLTDDGQITHQDSTATDAVAAFFFGSQLKRADLVRDLIRSQVPALETLPAR